MSIEAFICPRCNRVEPPPGLSDVGDGTFCSCPRVAAALPAPREGMTTPKMVDCRICDGSGLRDGRSLCDACGATGKVDADVDFLLNYAAALYRRARESRAEGFVLGPECVDIQGPIFERIADRLRALAGDGALDSGTQKLVAFGAWALAELRGDNIGCDIDGGVAQDEAVRLGILIEKPVSEPCGEVCACAEFGDMPGHCLFYADDVLPAFRRATLTPEPQR